VHCSKEYSGGITLMVINLIGSSVNITVNLNSGVVNGGTNRIEYVFTAWDGVDGGLFGWYTNLNGKLLNITSTGQLPPLNGVTVNNSQILSIK